MKKLKGGEHVWDKRYSNVKSPKQPFDYGTKKMLFGKYAGRKVDSLPLNYINWLLTNWKDLSIQHTKTLIRLVQLPDKAA